MGDWAYMIDSSSGQLQFFLSQIFKILSSNTHNKSRLIGINWKGYSQFFYEQNQNFSNEK